MATSEPQGTPGRPVISPAVRQRLQKAFEHANHNSTTGNFDYANDMFTQCVVGDPCNLVYVQSFLGNLQKKYNNNKKGAAFAGLKTGGSKSALKKAIAKEDWTAAVKAGLDVLALNPWEIPTLQQMATVSERLGGNETELAYLRFALDADAKSVEVNRQSALALARQGQFDQAISCWVRIQKNHPNNGDLREESERQIGNLQVEKTIAQGALRDEKTGVATSRGGGAAAAGKSEPVAPMLTHEQQLEKSIADRPDDTSLYLELAEAHVRNDRYQDAEKILEQALSVSGGDLRIREQLEDTQLRRARYDVLVAEQRAEREPTEAARELAQKMARDLVRREIEVFRSRVERYPTNTAAKFELGQRLKKTSQFNEAIKILQEARGDTRRKGMVHLELGECFQQIKQYKLAMSNYEASIASLSDRPEDAKSKMLALYRAGVLAMGLKDFNAAEKHLTALAALDFGYKDVADRLDKLAQVRDKG